MMGAKGRVGFKEDVIRRTNAKETLRMRELGRGVQLWLLKLSRNFLGGPALKNLPSGLHEF